MTGHVPVLADEVIDLLRPRPGGVLLDCTVGRGGHAERFAAAAADAGGAGGAAATVYGVDLDEGNVAYARDRVEATGARFVGLHDSFVRAPYRLRQAGERADAVLADLGIASSQLDDPARGFSFGRPGPLDMRLDRRQPLTAADLIATLGEAELADLIYKYGEEPLARAIARKLVRRREVEPIQTTTELASLVGEAYGPRARSSRLHPATRTFMALRIAVNEELTALRSLLEQVSEAAADASGGGWLAESARIVFISFHSLEDRMVKHAFAEMTRSGVAERLTRSPVRAAEAEVVENPRARSAKLRAVELR